MVEFFPCQIAKFQENDLLRKYSKSGKRDVLLASVVGLAVVRDTGIFSYRMRFK